VTGDEDAGETDSNRANSNVALSMAAHMLLRSVWWPRHHWPSAVKVLEDVVSIMVPP
jgi:hypothetical protein